LNKLQILVNTQARAVTGCFGTTNLDALAMESGLRPVSAQLENRLRRFGLRLISLPDGDQARKVVGARSGIGRRTKNALALAHRGRTDTTILLEEPEALDADTISEDDKAAKAEAERTRPGLTMFTDGSRLENGKVGYVVVWQKGRSWVGVKNHMETVKKLMTENAQHWQEPSRKRRNARRYRSGSSSSPTPKPLLGEWHRRPPAWVSSMRFWQGSTSERCGEPGRHHH
jgi:hypothetical protein